MSFGFRKKINITPKKKKKQQTNTEEEEQQDMVTDSSKTTGDFNDKNGNFGKNFMTHFFL